MSIVDPVCSCGHQEDEHEESEVGKMGLVTGNCAVPGCPCREYDPVGEVDGEPNSD